MARVEQRAVWGQVFGRLLAYLKEGGIAEGRMADLIGRSPSLLSKMKRGKGNAVRYVGKMIAFLRRYGVLENPLEALDWWALLGYHPSDAEMRQWYPGWQRPDRVGLLDQTWDLPDVYVERKAELDRIVTVLLEEKTFRQPAAKHVFLWGMAGVGKTWLARAVALDEEVRAYFRDGVLWGEKRQRVQPGRKHARAMSANLV